MGGTKQNSYPTCRDSRELLTPPTEQAFSVSVSIY